MVSKSSASMALWCLYDGLAVGFPVVSALGGDVPLKRSCKAAFALGEVPKTALSKWMVLDFYSCIM